MLYFLVTSDNVYEGSYLVINMCRFSHMDSRSRSKLSRCLSLVFVLSIFIHGVSFTATAIWMLASSNTGCDFLRKYYVPIFLLLAAGVTSMSLSSLSLVFTAFQRTSSFIRLFLVGITIITVLELATVIGAIALNKSTNDELQDEMLNSVADMVNGNSDVDVNERLVKCWNGLQEDYECCGARGYIDWCPNATTYAECVNGTINMLDSCKCETSCNTWDNNKIHGASCHTNVSNRLGTVFTINQALVLVCLLLQLVSYGALYFILPKLHSRAIVDTYKPKPAIDDSEM